MKSLFVLAVLIALAIGTYWPNDNRSTDIVNDEVNSSASSAIQE